jgi:2-haloacid dehalogenase
MSAPPPLGKVRACVFDAYGTLFDVASAAQRAADDLGDAAVPLAALWRDKQLQYSWLRAIQGRHADFRQVTQDALDYALDALGLAATARRERLMQLYLTLDAYPEVPAALHRLRAAGLRMAVLSNGTPAMLAAAVAHAGIDHLFDHVLSVEEVGVYKPHPDVYRLALDRLSLAAENIAFVSSNGWDAWAAAAFGMRAVWCNRQNGPRERLPGMPCAEIGALAELPPLLGA